LHSFIDVVSPLTPICEVRLQTVVGERFKITTSGVCPHTVSASGSPASAQEASEGFLFAGQKESRVHPSIKAASEAAAVFIRRRMNAGRANQKKRYKRLFFAPAPQKGRGEKRKGVSPRRARSAPLRLPKSTRSPVRGEPPQTAARATFWNIVRGEAWSASTMP
jgi:hypothetical protein